MTSEFAFEGLDESCDGLLLILDTARHGGWSPDCDELVGHVESCEICDRLGNFLEV